MRHVGGSADTYKCRWVQKLLAAGLQPGGFVVALVESREEAARMEIALIARLRARGVRLVNSTDGGDGAIGRKYTSEQRAVLKATMEAAWKRPEMRAKWSTALKAAWKRPKTRAKISAAIKAVYAQPEVDAFTSDSLPAPEES